MAIQGKVIASYCKPVAAVASIMGKRDVRDMVMLSLLIALPVAAGDGEQAKVKCFYYFIVYACLAAM